MLKVILIVVQGKPEGKSIPLVGPEFLIGRGQDCHLRPNSEEISRRHSKITIKETEAIIEDLGSRNGTRINGKPISEPHKLRSGELMQIGPLTFAVVIQGAEESQAQAPAARPPQAAAGQAASPSLDDVPQDQIEAWLVSDRGRPTPDRPSGVYDGDTLTINAYKEGLGSKSSGSIPTSSEPKAESKPAPKTEAKPAAKTEAKPAAKTEAKPAPKTEAKPEPEPEPADSTIRPSSDLFEEHLDGGIEQLSEGAGDSSQASEEPETEADAEPNDEEETVESATSPEDEMMDQNNPFYTGKKANAASPEAAASKVSYKDSSDAASDILRKMLDRRRGSRS